MLLISKILLLDNKGHGAINKSIRKSSEHEYEHGDLLSIPLSAASLFLVSLERAAISSFCSVRRLCVYVCIYLCVNML